MKIFSDASLIAKPQRPVGAPVDVAQGAGTLSTSTYNNNNNNNNNTNSNNNNNNNSSSSGVGSGGSIDMNSSLPPFGGVALSESSRQ